MTQSAVDVVREYIDLVNAQVGAYMHALSGFAGHHARVRRQVHRVLGPVGRRTDEAGQTVVVMASYEVPGRPAMILNNIVRADDYLALNASHGDHETQMGRSVLVFLYTAWECDIRPRMATARGVPLNEISSDVMGDLRIVRHAILHAGSMIRRSEHRRMKVLGQRFAADTLLRPNVEDMHAVFVAVKQDCGRMLGQLVPFPPGCDPSDLRDVAIQEP